MALLKLRLKKKYISKVEVNLSISDFFKKDASNIKNALELKVDKIKLKDYTADAWHIRGKRNYPLIIFSQGIGATYRLFYEGVLLFSALGFPVLSFSRPGDIEEVTSTYDLSVSKMANDIGDVMEILKYDKAHIIASSFGGIVAFKAIEAQPDKYLSLVTIGSFIRFPWGITHDLFYSLLKVVKVAELPMRDLGPFAPQLRFILSRSSKVVDFVLKEYQNYPQSTFQKYGDLLRFLDYSSSPPQVNLPMYFLQGDQDDLIPLATFTEMCKIYANAKSETIENCSHGPFLSMPDLLYRKIIDFYNEI